MSNKKEKFIEDLYDIYPNEEIWIIGTGKSLDDFPKDFFDDKIAIAVNGAIFKYQNVTYWHTFHSVWLEKMLQECPEVLNKTIVRWMGLAPDAEKDVLKDKTSIAYWLCVTHGIKKRIDAQKTLVEIYRRKRRVGFSEDGTTAHTAIQSAMVMGAKKITLVGCEHKRFGNLPEHADVMKGGYIDYTGNVTNRNVWTNLPPDTNNATIILADVLSDFGIEMQRYYNSDTEYYKKGYENII